MNPYLAILIGLSIAGPAVFLILCLCAIASDADDRAEEMRRQHKEQKSGNHEQSQNY